MQNLGKNIIIVLLIIVAGLGGFFVGKKQGAIDREKKLAELNKRIDAFLPPVPEEVFSVLGEIKEVKPSVMGLSMEINSFKERYFPGEDAKKEIIDVYISEDTKIKKFEIPQPEIDPKTNLPKEPGPDFRPPEPKFGDIKLSDLKVGDNIGVKSKENIRNKTLFVAEEIIKY